MVVFLGTSLFLAPLAWFIAHGRRTDGTPPRRPAMGRQLLRAGCVVLLCSIPLFVLLAPTAWVIVFWTGVLAIALGSANGAGLRDAWSRSSP
jgi:hypothetical protein